MQGRREAGRPDEMDARKEGYPIHLASSHALLDVTKGRKQLLRMVNGHGMGRSRQPTGARVPVLIHGAIVGAWSGDDGVSQMFEIEVSGVDTGALVLTDGAGI